MAYVIQCSSYQADIQYVKVLIFLISVALFSYLMLEKHNKMSWLTADIIEVRGDTLSIVYVCQWSWCKPMCLISRLFPEVDVAGLSPWRGPGGSKEHGHRMGKAGTQLTPVHCRNALRSSAWTCREQFRKNVTKLFKSEQSNVCLCTVISITLY